MAGPWEQYAAPAADGPWAQYAQPKPQGFMENAADFIKSIPRGLAKGLASPVAMGSYAIDPETAMGLARSGVDPGELARETGNRVNSAIEGGIESAHNATGILPKPEGPAGQIAAAGAEAVGNPLSWVGPGGPLLKFGGAVLSGTGGEGARQAAEGTAFEKPAQIAGALTGGVAAAKTLGPSIPKAATPTYRELKTEADRLYTAARNSGVEFHPQGVAQLATRAEQELAGPKHGFTGGATGDAPRTFAVLERLQNPPSGAIVTASNVDALRKNLARLSRETSEGKPTPDAAAASILLNRLNAYLEAPPPGHVVAGDADAYLRLTREANANYAAGQRVRNFDARLTKAENQAARQVHGSVDNAIRSKLGTVLDDPRKLQGLNEAEKAQLKLINEGSRGSELLRQAGRGGAGVIPVMGQLAATGPVFAAGGLPGLALQGGVAAALYGARKGSEAITKKRAKDLVEMLARRSPEYERRVRNLPPADTTAGKAAIIRALLGAAAE